MSEKSKGMMEYLHHINYVLFYKYKKQTYLLFALIILFMVVGVFRFENSQYRGEMLTSSEIKSLIAKIEKGQYNGKGVDLSEFSINEDKIQKNDHLNEQTSKSYSVAENGYIRQIIAVLTWEDEPDANILYDNQPDEFRLIITSADENYSVSSDWVANQHGSSGNINLTLTLPDDIVSHTREGGNWTVKVEMGNAGDQKKIRPFPGLIGRKDDGNDYSLEIIISYYSGEK